MKTILLGSSAVGLARTLKRTGSTTVRFMCTITFTRITAAGIMAIGMPGSGTRVAGFNGAESTILFIEHSHETSTIVADSGRYFDGPILFYTS